MKKLLWIMMFGLILLSCQNDLQEGDHDGAGVPEVRPFDFTLEYGIMGHNEISSIDQRLVFDTSEGSVEITYAFTEEELKSIQAEFVRLDIANRDYSFLQEQHHHFEPNEVTRLILIHAGQKFVFYWSMNNMPPYALVQVEEVLELMPLEGYEEAYDSYLKLTTLKNYIIDMIKGKDFYQDLPPMAIYI